MAAKTVTREDLHEAVRCRAGLSPSDAESLVAQVLEEITACLGRGEGTFLKKITRLVERVPAVKPWRQRAAPTGTKSIAVAAHLGNWGTRNFSGPRFGTVKPLVLYEIVIPFNGNGIS